MSSYKIKILVIMLYWHPYEGPLMPIYGSIFKELLKKGHQITLVTSFPHFRKGRSETWRQYRGKLFEKADWQGVNLIRSYVFAPIFDQSRSGLSYRALNFISFNISSIVASIFLAGKADVILAPSSPPLTNGLCAWIVSCFKRCAVVYNVQDIYPDMAVKMDIVRNKATIGLLQLIEKIVYLSCEKVVAISSGMASILLKKGVPKKKISTIENLIDTDAIKPMPPTNDFSRQYNLIDKYVVMYAGNMGVPHGVEVIVKAAQILQEEKEICICFVARGENKNSIELYVEEKHLLNVVFIPMQPRERLPLVLASSSIGLVTYRKGLSEFSVPSKLLTIMGAARPVIASIDGDSTAATIITDAQCGIIAPPENPEALAQAIVRLKNEPTLARQMGQNGRYYVKRHFQKDVISAKYEKLFLELAC